MLGGEHGIQEGDLILLPNLPENGQFLIVRVASGGYTFAPIKVPGRKEVDYGHILPVETSLGAPIPNQEERVSGDLRRSLTCRSRSWSLASYEDEVSRLYEAARSPEFCVQWRDSEGLFRRVVSQAVDSVAPAIEAALERELRAFRAAELEHPCQRLLERLYPGADVDSKGGSGEKGADLLVRWEDPLGEGTDLSWCMVVQVKDWRGEASDVGAIDQLCKAHKAWAKETGLPVRGLRLFTLCDSESERFKSYRERKEEELGLPIDFVSRERLLRWFRRFVLANDLAD